MGSMPESAAVFVYEDVEVGCVHDGRWNAHGRKSPWHCKFKSICEIELVYRCPQGRAKMSVLNRNVMRGPLPCQKHVQDTVRAFMSTSRQYRVE